MKFRHSNNHAIEGIDIPTDIVKSHSALNGTNDHPFNKEHVKSLPRPPVANGNIIITKRDCLNQSCPGRNSANNSRDGVELQQKKVAEMHNILQVY